MTAVLHIGTNGGDAAPDARVAPRRAEPLPPERMHALLEAVAGIGRDLSPPAVLRRAAVSARDLTGARHAELIILGSDGEVTGRATAVRAARRPGTDPVPGPALPVELDGAVVGTLRVAGDAPFTAHDVEVLTTLATATAAAIGNARRYERGHRREEWLRATNEVTAVLRTGPSEPEGLALLARRAREIPDAVLALVATPDGPDLMRVRAVDGALSRELLDVRLPMSDSITGDVFTTGRPRIVDEVVEATLTRSIDTFHRLPGGIARLGPAAFVPLSTGQHPLGVLMVAKGHGAVPFDHDDLGMVLSYAGHAALAIEFAGTQRDRQRLALLEERDRIASDLHDLVIQRLFAIGLGMNALSRTQDAAAVAPRLSGFVDEIDQTIREIRRTIFSLQQPAGGAHSLRGEILRAISDATTSLGYEPTVRLEGPLDSVIPQDAQLDLIATLREALSNAVRHARAEQVRVTIAVDRDATELALLVHDDGVGLPGDIKHRGGLTTMTQRARRRSGRCRIDSPDGGGTRVDWRVPLRAPEEREG